VGAQFTFNFIQVLQINPDYAIGEKFESNYVMKTKTETHLLDFCGAKVVGIGGGGGAGLRAAMWQTHLRHSNDSRATIVLRECLTCVRW
jgi:hypothetical protein